MTRDIFLFLSAFLACAVEMVEALTIVLAGAGVDWPGQDAALPVILALLAAAAFVAIRLLRRAPRHAVAGEAAAEAAS